MAGLRARGQRAGSALIALSVRRFSITYCQQIRRRTTLVRLQVNREAALARADDFRKWAASALAVLNHSVVSGFRYYLGRTGVNGTLDPGGLLSPNQLTNDKKAISRLESQRAAQEQELGRSGIDLKTVVADLQKGGDSAKQIADVLSKFRGFKGAQSLSSLLQGGGGVPTNWRR